MLRPWGKQVSFLPFSGACVIMYMLLPCNTVLVQPCPILDKKASISSHFIVFMASFKSVRSGIGLVTVVFLRESSVQCPANRQDILDPLSKTYCSSISLSLMMFMIRLMVGVPRVTNTFDPKAVKSGMTRAT